MNKYLLLFLSLFFLSGRVGAENISSLNVILQDQGIEKLIAVVREISKSEEGVDFLVLNDELHYMGKDGGIVSPSPVWKVTNSSKGVGVQLSLKIGHYYFQKSPKNKLGLESCSHSGATSGTAYKVNSNESYMSFSWSCGSMGCSYWIRFGKGESPCL